MKNKNIISIVLSVFALISIGLLIILSFYTNLWADDFGIIKVLETKSVFNHMKFGFLNWDGRFAGPGGLLQAVLMKYVTPEYISLFWSPFLFLSAFYILKILQLKITVLHKISISETIILTAIISGLLWLGMRTHISQTLYWATGGFYFFINFLILFWIYIVLKKLNNGNIKIFNLFLLLFTVYTAMGSHNATIALIAFVTIELILSVKYKKKQQAKFLLLILLALFVGLTVIIIAPGNFTRLNTGNSYHFEILHTIPNYFVILKKYIVISLRLVVAAVFGAFLLKFFTQKRKNNKIQNKENIFVYILRNYEFAIVALSTLVVFIPAPQMASGRTSIFFMSFIFIFIIQFIFSISKKINLKINLGIVLYSSLTFVFLIAFSLIVLKTINKAKNTKFEMTNRIEFFKKNKGKDVVVPPINTVPFELKFNDITTNKMDWKNQSCADYYELKSVKISNTK